MESMETKMAVMASQLNTISNKVDAIDLKLDKNYITADKMQSYVDRIERLEKLVYGVVAVIGIALVGAVIRLVIIQ